jgi:acylglycerol lipase
MRGYINGTGRQLRLYYTKLEPNGLKKATICIIHGFGEHSGRFLHVNYFFFLKILKYIYIF